VPAIALTEDVLVQAEENEEKRKQAAARLKTAYDTNVALLEKKRQAYYKRERENVERRKKQAEEREALDQRKKLMSLEKAEKRKVCAYVVERENLC
jgi:hypothetical protein